MEKKERILKFVNKDRIATGTTATFSNTIGIKPMYLRGALVAATVIINPFVGITAYGAAYAFNRIKK